MFRFLVVLEYTDGALSEVVEAAEECGAKVVKEFRNSLLGKAGFIAEVDSSREYKTFIKAFYKTFPANKYDAVACEELAYDECGEDEEEE